MTAPRPRSADTGSTTGSTTGSDVSTGRDRHGPRTTEQPLEDRVVGDEPMTGPQRSYLQTLAREAGEDLPEEELTKAAASELIERLQRATGRIPADRGR